MNTNSLHNVKDLEGFAVGAMDGELGTVTDLYFDDRHWAVRYLVVETGGWLSGRKVLISPAAIAGVGWQNEVIEVRLSRQQVRDSPSVDTDKPVSRQHEMDYSDYYGYPYYWEGINQLWGPLMYPLPPAETPAESRATSGAAREDDRPEGAQHDGKRETADSHLRSVNDVIGHEAMATDGSIGSVNTFVFDDESWSIRQLIVDTRKWLPGKRVALWPRRIQRISWPERQVYLDMTRDEVRASPEYADQVVATYQIHE